MSFAKLDSGIVNSTLWVLPDDVLRVWIWLMARADECGCVDASFVAIAFHCFIPRDRAREILTWLESIEAGSFGIDATPMGWRIRNYERVHVQTRAAQLASSAWRKIRRVIFERDGYACVYCGAIGVALQCDHIHPVALGGSDDPSNLATACGSCNASKGARTLDEWRLK